MWIIGIILGLLVQQVTSQDVVSNGITKTGHKIVGGAAASISEVPWQGWVNADGSLCGCSLLNNQWVVTAAHCTDGLTASQMFVNFGISNLQVLGSQYTLLLFVQHPDYNAQTLANDISLLKINGTISYTSNIQPIPLPVACSAVAAATDCVISGWGTLVENGNISLDLQIATVPIVSESLCTSWYGTNGISVTSSQVCAGFAAGGIDTCQGDSGGPLACQNSNGTSVLEGITSFGVGCARPQLPGVYARVSFYVTWIEATMAGTPDSSSACLSSASTSSSPTTSSPTSSSLTSSSPTSSSPTSSSPTSSSPTSSFPTSSSPTSSSPTSSAHNGIFSLRFYWIIASIAVATYRNKLN